MRVGGLLSEASLEAEALGTLDRSGPRRPPVTSIGARAEQRFAELARDQPAFFRGVRRMAENYVHSFGRAASPQQLRGLLISQVVGHAVDGIDLQGPWAKLGSNALGSTSGDAATALLEAQYRKFVIEMANTSDLRVAIEAASKHRVPVFGREDWAMLRNAADDLPDQRRIVQALARRPASISRLPEAHVNLTGAQNTIQELARRSIPSSPSASFADALASFDDFFPGVEGAEAGTPRSEAQRRAGVLRGDASSNRAASARNFTRARSYGRLRGFARVGGVLLGRSRRAKSLFSRSKTFVGRLTAVMSS